MSGPTRSQQLQYKRNHHPPKTSSNTTLDSTRHCACVVQLSVVQLSVVVWSVWYCGGAVTDVDCERGCPPPVRWPTLLHLSSRGPSSPTSPTTWPRQLISPPSGPPILSLHPQATLASFLGCQVHCSVFLVFFSFNRLKCSNLKNCNIKTYNCTKLPLVNVWLVWLSE